MTEPEASLRGDEEPSLDILALFQLRLEPEYIEAPVDPH
jgi:hypothetical protein